MLTRCITTTATVINYKTGNDSLLLSSILKFSAFGSTEPHRIHSRLVGNHGPAFLACLPKPTRLGRAKSMQRMRHLENDLRTPCRASRNIRLSAQLHDPSSYIYRLGKSSIQGIVLFGGCFLPIMFLCLHWTVSCFVSRCLCDSRMRMASVFGISRLQPAVYIIFVSMAPTLFSLL